MNQTAITTRIAVRHHKANTALIARLLPAFAITAWLFLMVGWALPSPFAMADDHEIVTYLMQPDTLSERIQSDFEFGRFRPLYYALRQLQYRALGAQPLAWHATVFMVGVATLTLIYRILRVFVPPIYAAYGMVIPFLYPDSGAIWYRLGPQETLGMALVVTALYALTRHHDRLFMAAAIASFYYKESFVFLLPAFLAMRVAFGRYYAEPWRNILFPCFALAAFAIPAVVPITYLKIAGAGTSGDAATGSFGAAWGMNIIALTAPVAFLTPLLLALRVRALRRWLIVGFVIMLLWLLPQAALYTMLFERYHWPAILAPVVAIPLALAVLRRQRRLQAIAIASLILAGGASSWSLLYQPVNAALYAVRSQTFQEMVRTAALHDPYVARIDYPLEYQVEERVSSVAFLRWYGFKGRVDFGPDCQGAYCDLGRLATHHTAPVTRVNNTAR